jgi:hypothetical protein
VTAIKDRQNSLIYRLCSLWLVARWRCQRGFSVDKSDKQWGFGDPLRSRPRAPIVLQMVGQAIPDDFGDDAAGRTRTTFGLDRDPHRSDNNTA